MSTTGTGARVGNVDRISSFRDLVKRLRVTVLVVSQNKESMASCASVLCYELFVVETTENARQNFYSIIRLPINRFNDRPFSAPLLKLPPPYFSQMRST